MSRKLDPDNDPERLNVVVPKALVQRLNEWRAANGFVGKSEAARILIERSLDAEDSASRELSRRSRTKGKRTGED